MRKFQKATIRGLHYRVYPSTHEFGYWEVWTDDYPPYTPHFYLEREEGGMENAILHAITRRPYPTAAQYLEDWFFSGQPLEQSRPILVAEEIKKVRRERANQRKMVRSSSPRILSGRKEAIVLYPSGKRIEARVRSGGDISLVEPVTPNTAAYLIPSRELSNSVINLASVDYIRVVHRGKNVKFIREFR